MKACELIKETFLRRTFVWVVHLSWLVIYGLFWLLFLPSGMEAGVFIFLWGGFFLPLALSAGIFGDDIASGRICVLATKPFWLGQFYIYRLLGLSLQGAVHLLLGGVIVFGLDALMGQGTPNSKRAYNSLVLLLAVALFYLLLGVLASYWLEHGTADFMRKLIRFTGLPFNLLHGMAKGEYGKYSLAVGKYGLTKTVACTVHCLILTTVYATIGVLLLTRRQFSSQRD